MTVKDALDIEREKEWNAALHDECQELTGNLHDRLGWDDMAKIKTTDAETDLEGAAARAIGAVESHPLGEPPDRVIAEAQQAIDVPAKKHHGIVFAGLPTTTDSTLMEFTLGLQALPTSGPVTAGMIALHEEALDSGRADLAAVVRSSRGRKIIGRRAYDSRLGNAEAAASFEAKQLRQFEAAIVSQLARRGLLEPSASFLATRLPALQVRLAAAIQKHEQHAADEVERQRQTALSTVDRAKADADAAMRAEWPATLRAEQMDPDGGPLARRQHLAAVFRRYPAFTFDNILGRTWTGAEAAAAIEAGAPFSDFFRAQGRGQQPKGYRS